MKVLAGFEFSGRVRDAFLALGHDAISCDLLPTDSPGPHHQGDIRDILDDGFDLAILHPPCTFLAKAGARWLYDQERYPQRWQDMIDAAVLFRDMLNADIPRIAVENPGMHGWASKIVGRRADQVVQPWMFGHPESKATGLWLKGLPPLRPTDDVHARMMQLPRRERDRVHYAAPGPDRWKARSVTYAGIAAAMADQWGNHIAQEAAA